MTRRPALTSCGLSPRVRGNPLLGQRMMSQRGSIPRVRGNPPAGGMRLASPRSIPACAGEPRRLVVCAWPARVYPRVCGGTGQAH